MEAHRLVSFDEVLRLRWLPAAAQPLIVGISALTVTPDLPLAPMAAAWAVGVASNVALWARERAGRPASEGLVAAVLALDALLLTALLALSGGATNPFAPLYLLVVALAAMVVGDRWVWALVALTAACYGALFAVPSPHAHHGGSMASHATGMWIAFALGAPFLAFALLRLREEVAGSRAAAERSARLASLATLAAGAAHELATPLSTIAVIAGEWEASADAAVRSDAGLLAREVDRCRRIVAQLTASSGAGMGESPTPIGARELLERAVEGRPVAIEAPALVVAVPTDLVGQVLRRLVDNALAASPEVAVTAAADGAALVLTVTDRGPGMSPEVLARAGEPFFTTRSPGQGMGLGLYYARSVLEHLGGSLTIDSSPGAGTRMVARLPGAVVEGA